MENNVIVREVPEQVGIGGARHLASPYLDAKIPSGPMADKWEQHKFDSKLVNPANKRKFTVIVVGTGLAGASAAATLAELGYNVQAFTYHDSPRRAHSIAAQGGINAAKNYQNDGDSVYRLFYDTIKGGDFRAREANVYRLAQVSNNIIDQCISQGVPFAREYGGYLDNRSFGGAQVSRTFYARGQTGQQLLLGAYQQMMRQVQRGAVKLFTRREMLDLVTIDGQARGITVRNMVTGEIESHAADAVLLCTGGYSNVYYLSTNAKACNVTAPWKAFKKGAFLGVRVRFKGRGVLVLGEGLCSADLAASKMESYCAQTGVVKVKSAKKAKIFMEIALEVGGRRRWSVFPRRWLCPGRVRAEFASRPANRTNGGWNWREFLGRRRVNRCARRCFETKRRRR